MNNTNQNQMIISHLQPPIPTEQWENWQRSQGNPFHAACFINALSNLGWKGVYATQIDTQGVLHSTATAVVRTKAGLSWANFFAEPVGEAGSEALMAALVSELKKLKANFIQTSGSMGRWKQDQIQVTKQTSQFLSTVPFGTYEIDLTRSQEEILKSFHAKHRKKIRLAEAAGAEVREFGTDYKEEDLNTLFKLVQRTFGRGNADSPPENYFLGISQAWLKNNFARMYLVYQNEKIVAGVVIPFSKLRAYSWIGGSGDPAEIPFGANDLLQWKLMLSLKSMGVPIFDFGGARPDVKPGSKIEGIQKFKERFGGVFVPTDQWQADLSWKGPILRLAQKLLR